MSGGGGAGGERFFGVHLRLDVMSDGCVNEIVRKLCRLTCWCFGALFGRSPLFVVLIGGLTGSWA